MQYFNCLKVFTKLLTIIKMINMACVFEGRIKECHEWSNILEVGYLTIV